MLLPKNRLAAVSKVVSAVLVVAILVIAAGVGVAAYHKAGPAKEATVLAALQSNSDFSTLVNALSAAGLSSTLSSSTAHTIFAPTNEAFSSLPPGVLTTLLGNPTRLALVLDYHIVAGKLNETSMFELTSLMTLQGSSLPVGVSGTSLEVGGDASLTQAQIPCTNGVIYPINNVLFPPTPVNTTLVTTTLGLMTILQTAESLGLSYLVQGLEIAGLGTTMSSPGPYTLFAPSNSAMTAFSCGTPYDNCLDDLMYLFSNVTATTAVMQDNIASGNFTSAQLVNAGSVTTLEGLTLPATSTSSTVNVGAATITQKDIQCSNGYIDITNLVLVPPGMNH
jgi:transforming growth factor-beta-induced protein